HLFSPLLEEGGRIARRHLDTFLAVEIVQETGEIGGIDVTPDGLPREDHDHLSAVHRQRGSHFPTDETTSNHSKTLAAVEEFSQLSVVLQGAVINGGAITVGQPAWRAASSQQQLFVRVIAAQIILHSPGARVERIR